VQEWRSWSEFVTDIVDPRHGFDYTAVHDFVRQAEHERTSEHIDLLSVPEQAAKFQLMMMSKLNKRLREPTLAPRVEHNPNAARGTCHFYNSETGCTRSACKFAHRCSKKGCTKAHPAHEHTD
jgi:hypothetical protein